MLRPWTWPLGSWEAVKGFEAEGLFSCSPQETCSSTSSHATASVKLVFGPRVSVLHVHTSSATMFNRVHRSHLLRSSCAFFVSCLPAWQSIALWGNRRSPCCQEILEKTKAVMFLEGLPSVAPVVSWIGSSLRFLGMWPPSVTDYMIASLTPP